jgi:hypothetical protein
MQRKGLIGLEPAQFLKIWFLVMISRIYFKNLGDSVLVVILNSNFCDLGAQQHFK